VHCWHTCTTIRKAAAPVLLPHHRPPICLRVVGCFAYARACRNELSRPLAKHFRSHSRTRRFDSARTSGFCNSVALFTCCDAIRVDLPPPPVLRYASNLRCVASAIRTSAPHYSSSSAAGPVLASALPHRSRARPNRVRSWPASRLAYTARLLLARCHATAAAPPAPAPRACTVSCSRVHAPAPPPSAPARVAAQPAHVLRACSSHRLFSGRPAPALQRCVA
jgi:hypothetical protein